MKIIFQCDVDGEVIYEFPSYNFTEALDGLWSPDDERYTDGIYGGVLLKASSHVRQSDNWTSDVGKRFLWIMFPRVQTQLRNHCQKKCEAETDLYQWFRGSKYCLATVEALITLGEEDSMVVKVRGPKGHEKECFFFFEEILGCIDQVTLA